jgi:PEP-CTERM motif-containing protein
MRFRDVSLTGIGALAIVLVCTTSATAGSIIYSNLGVNVPNPMAAASRLSSPGGPQEIETADDFILNFTTSITSASFIGLVPLGSSVTDLNLEIYRVFPADSGPFDGRVTTRVNSPSDVALQERQLSMGGISSFTETSLSSSFTAQNSVLNGINPFPNQFTGGEGSVTGQEVRFDVTFTTPFVLTPDHYFFVPQVELSTGNFFWLSAARPIPLTSPNTPISPDLQAWIRNEVLDPDWSRIGTDIVGGATPPTFNMAFQLEGDVVPEPASLVLLSTGLIACAWRLRRRGHGQPQPPQL